MKLQNTVSLLAFVVVGMSCMTVAADQFGSTTGFTTARRETVKLDGGPSPSAVYRPSADELRQARALERMRQREARMHANAWAGYEPLRPNWPANSFTNVQYNVYRPYHIWSVYDYVFLP